MSFCFLPCKEIKFSGRHWHQNTVLLLSAYPVLPGAHRSDLLHWRSTLDCHRSPATHKHSQWKYWVKQCISLDVLLDFHAYTNVHAHTHTGRTHTHTHTHTHISMQLLPWTSNSKSELQFTRLASHHTQKWWNQHPVGRGSLIMSGLSMHTVSKKQALICCAQFHAMERQKRKKKFDHMAVSTHWPQWPSLNDIATAWVWWLFTVICNYMPPLPPTSPPTLSPQTPPPPPLKNLIPPPALFSLVLNIS